MSNVEKGRAGEDAALLYLEKQGMRLLERNLRRPGGEIDLVMQDQNHVVFIEVKMRSRQFVPAQAVDLGKQKRIGRVALKYLMEKGWMERPVRFDVVEVLRIDYAMQIRHTKEAFWFTGKAYFT